MVMGYLCLSSMLEVVQLFVSVFLMVFVKSFVFLFLGSLIKTNRKRQLLYGQFVCNMKF